MIKHILKQVLTAILLGYIFVIFIKTDVWVTPVIQVLSLFSSMFFLYIYREKNDVYNMISISLGISLIVLTFTQSRYDAVFILINILSFSYIIKTIYSSLKSKQRAIYFIGILVPVTIFFNTAVLLQNTTMEIQNELSLIAFYPLGFALIVITYKGGKKFLNNKE